MTQQLPAQNSRWATIRQRFRESTPYFVVGALLTLFIVAYLFHRIFITVPAGHAGVHFEWLGGGTDINTVYDEGLHIIAPWNSMTIYNLRVQEVDQNFDVLTSDGLAIQATMSVRFRPTRRLIGMLHKQHGPNYVESYLLAELGSSARRIIGLVTPAEFYSSARDSVEKAIDDHLIWELRELDEYPNTEWPNPATFDEWLTTKADSIIAAQKFDEEQADSLKTSVYAKFNLLLVTEGLRDKTLKAEVYDTGPIDYYYNVSTHIDSLSDNHQIITKRLTKAESVLYDSDEEREAGMHDLISEESDTLVTIRYRELLEEHRGLESKLDSWRSKLRTVMESYDTHFMVIDVHDVLIKNIVLPPQIAGAIQNKLEQEQVAEEFTFRLIRERREAERKRIEAEGIRKFQDIISDEITPFLLQWKGIEATLELAKSNNTKVIVIGSGEDGLPIILNPDSR